jgi:hypothetical protein
MKRFQHLHRISNTPPVAQSNFVIKLDTTTAMIDRLLLVPRQIPWKAIGTGSDTDTDTDTDTGTDVNTEL